MRVLRTIRGIIGTALVWSLPWAVFGGAMLVAYFTVRRGEIPFESFRIAARVNWILFRVGAEVSAVAGALSGALFASLLASRGGRLTFSQLSASRLAAYGALGGTGVGLAAVTLATSVLGRPASALAPLIGISAVLGAVSAVSTLLLARRARAPEASSAIGESSDPRSVSEAFAEVERFLSAPDNLTTLAADGRVNEGRVRRI